VTRDEKDLSPEGQFTSITGAVAKYRSIGLEVRSINSLGHFLFRWPSFEEFASMSTKTTDGHSHNRQELKEIDEVSWLLPLL
jgi:hypothetical protein